MPLLAADIGNSDTALGLITGTALAIRTLRNGDAEPGHRHRAAEREHDIGDDQERGADREDAPAVDPIREPPGGIRRQRVRDVHHDEHGWHVR